MSGKVIAIEGIIGIGKTTLGSSLVQLIGPKAKFFPEYVNHEFLAAYIKDIQKYSFSFQLFMMLKRVQILHEAFEYARQGGIAVVDRSLRGDQTFALMQYRQSCFSEEEWRTYLSIIEQENVPEPDITLYLVCSPETSLRRMRSRGNQSEINGYSIDYMQNLAQAYELTMQSVPPDRLIVMDWEKDQALPLDRQCPEIRHLLEKLL